jgi:hypothetical protein
MRLVKQWRPVYFFGESGPIRRAMEPLLDRMMREERTHTSLDWLSSGNDKAANARTYQALQANGRIYWPETEWADRAIDQCLRFPGAKHDDAVDTCSLFGRGIDKTWAAIPRPPDKPQLHEAFNAPIPVSAFLKDKKKAAW